MADVFKQQQVRFTLGGKRCPAGTPGAVRTVTVSAKWYGTVGGKRVPLSADKRVAQQMLRKLLGDAERQAVGLVDPFAAAKATPLVDHLKDYLSHLTAKGDTPEHVLRTSARVTAVLSGCEMTTTVDLEATHVASWLTAQRTDRRPVAVPAGQAFSPSQAAAVLGITLSGLRTAMQRHGLTGSGNGKARRLDRSVLERLAVIQARGWSPASQNQYVRAVRGFTRWLVQARRIPTDPFDTLKTINTSTDIRRGRRELSHHELQRLLAVTQTGATTFRGLNGMDRYLLYATAAGTGFRAGALAHLTPRDFDHTATQPTVTLPARFNKSRKRKVQPLPADLADLLRGYLANRPSGHPVWSGSWATKGQAAMMLRIDLEAANIPYTVPGPDGPLHFDFHSFRHSYLTLLGRSGVDLRTAQLLAGHSTPTLTARYSHRSMTDLAEAVAKLPNVTVSGSGYTQVTQPGDAAGHQPSPSDSSPPISNTGGRVVNPRENLRVDPYRPPVTPADTIPGVGPSSAAGGITAATISPSPAG